MTEVTATEILNHCKAVVNGEIPQPEPFWVTSEDSDYVFYYEKPKEDEANPIALIMWQFAPNEIPYQNLTLAARILGLDRPAPVVELEWEWADIQAADRRMDAQFNEWITAHIFTLGTLTEPQRAKVVIGHLEIWETFPIGTTITEARAWCVEQIKKITTPRT